MAHQFSHRESLYCVLRLALLIASATLTSAAVLLPNEARAAPMLVRPQLPISEALDVALKSEVTSEEVADFYVALAHIEVRDEALATVELPACDLLNDIAGISEYSARVVDRAEMAVADVGEEAMFAAESLRVESTAASAGQATLTESLSDLLHNASRALGDVVPELRQSLARAVVLQVSRVGGRARHTPGAIHQALQAAR